MKYSIVLLLLSTTLFGKESPRYNADLILNVNLLTSKAPKYSPNSVPKNMSVQEKKARFYALINPAVQKVHAELTQQYESVKADLKTGKNAYRIEELKQRYKVQTDAELLLALKPHPQSIALAQAALESSWGTSRFFTKAKNIFGMWSVNPHEPRIAASQKRGGTRTIWLKKFASIEDSVRAYYRLMGRGDTYKEFREVRYQTNDPYEIIQKLDKYSEIGEKYPEELESMISYNKLKKFDK